MRWLIPGLVGGLVSLILLLTSTAIVVFSPFFYQHTFDTHGVLREVPQGLSITYGLLDYFKGDGALPSAFSGSEAQHMQDVKGLVVGGMYLWYGLVVLLLILLSMCLDDFRLLGTSLFVVSCVLLAVVVVGWLLPFDMLFEKFHGFLFAPGSWQFPVDSFIITLYPRGVFVDAALFIGLQLVFWGVLCAAMGVFSRRRW